MNSNNRKTFGRLMRGWYPEYLFIIDKNSGDLIKAEYKGKGFVSPIHNEVIYFKIKNNPFIHMMVSPDKNLSYVELDNFIVTPSKTIANELRKSYCKI